MSAEFDKYAEQYDTLLSDSIKASGYDASYFDEQKVREVHRVLKKESALPLTIMNFGCGTGKSEKYIRKYFPNSSIHSADVSEESLKLAAERNQNIKEITFHHFNDVTQFNPGVEFDIIFVANVFHHIPEELHATTLKQLRKLLKTTGKLFIFEHNPLNPLTRNAFATCEFDHGCKMIPSGKLKKLAREAGFAKPTINFTLFFPGFLKKLTFLEPYLSFFPLGAQYYLTSVKGS